MLDVVQTPTRVECLEPYVAAGVFGAMEVHLAAFVLDTAALDDAHVALAVAAAAWAMANGHDCADLGLLPEVVETHRRRRHADAESPLTPITWPDIDTWRAALAAPSAAAVVRVAAGPDQDSDNRPIVLRGDRVYLQRLWLDECALAGDIASRAGAVDVASGVEAILDRLISRVDPKTGGENRQRIAADAVLANRFAVIVGGPGTGKTYAVARVLAALMEDARERGVELSVTLAAPTGKASQRLTEAVAGAVSQLSGVVSDDTIAAMRAVSSTTIHRLLGAMGTTGRFRRTATNPVPHDVVIVDETSMVSLPLMARLVAALRPDARLVLVGDPDQLESVDVGAILADLVAARTHDALRGRVVALTENRRFDGRSPIAQLAVHIRDHDAEAAERFAREAPEHDFTAGDESSTVRLVETSRADTAHAVEAVRQFLEPQLQAMVAAARAGDVAGALDALGQCRILCAHRRGSAGVATWNRIAEGWVRGNARGEWYAGRPVLVTRNDSRVGLFNGDTGVVVAIDGRVEVAFPRENGTWTLLPTFALADVDTCFAMTVHKSQGSEYERVAFVLPPAGSALIGRELAYTGVSRARSHLLVVGTADVLGDCVRTPARRMSGLGDALALGDHGAR